MISDPIWLGGIVAAGSVFTVVFNRWAVAKDKKVQYARDDVLDKRTRRVAEKAEEVVKRAKEDSDNVREVAAQAALAAKLLLDHDAEQAETARLVAELVTLKLHELSQGQAAIHVLVNSNLQAALEAQLVALKGWLAAVVAVGGDKMLIVELESRVSVLETSLADRMRSVETANAEGDKLDAKAA